MNCREEQRGIAIGFVMAGTKVGPAIGAPFAAFLITQAGWQMMFVLLGLCSVALAYSVGPLRDRRRIAAFFPDNGSRRASPTSPAIRSFGAL